MSGAIKSIGKVFQRIGQAIRSIAKSPIFKAIVVAAAIYFTAGAALAAFAAPEVAAGAVTAATATEAGATEFAVGLAGDESAGLSMAAAGDTAASTAGTVAGVAGDESAGLALGSQSGTGAVGDAINASGAQDLASSAGAPPDMTASASTTPGAPAPEAPGAPPGTQPGAGTPTADLQTAGAGAPQTAAATGQPGVADAMGNMPGDPAYSPTGAPSAGAPSSGSLLGDSEQALANQQVGGNGLVSRVMSAGDKFLQGVGKFVQTPAGMTLAGNTALGVGKGVMDARNAQAQRDYLAQQRATYSAAPDVSRFYKSGLVGRYIDNSNTKGG